MALEVVSACGKCRKEDKELEELYKQESRMRLSEKAEWQFVRKLPWRNLLI